MILYHMKSVECLESKSHFSLPDSEAYGQKSITHITDPIRKPSLFVVKNHDTVPDSSGFKEQNLQLVLFFPHFVA